MKSCWIPMYASCFFSCTIDMFTLSITFSPNTRAFSCHLCCSACICGWVRCWCVVCTSVACIPLRGIPPQTFSKDGTVAMGTASITEDGKLLAYSVTKSGSDWQTIKVRVCGRPASRASFPHPPLLPSALCPPFLASSILSVFPPFVSLPPSFALPSSLPPFRPSSLPPSLPPSLLPSLVHRSTCHRIHVNVLAHPQNIDTKEDLPETLEYG
jgi:hypothetical protein